MAFDQNAKLTFVLQAKDLASKTFKEARGNLGHLDDASKKTSKSFGGLTKLGITPMNVAFGAAALGATVLTGALIESVKLAIDEQKNIAKLNASLKANIAGWDGSTASIERTISKREGLAFTDDELRDSLAKLVGATKDVDKAFAIQRTAMDLARFKGISLGDATEALTKVEAGSFRILKSLGIVLKEGATQQDALNAVTRVAAGQARAYADTVEGKMLTAQIRINDAMEDLGARILPVVADVLDGLTGHIDTTKEHIDKVRADIEKGGFIFGKNEKAIAEMKRIEAALAETRDELDRQERFIAQDALTIPTSFKWAADRTVQTVRALPGSIAKALRDNRQDWQKAWDDYKQTLKDAMSTGAQIAKLEAILTSKRLAAGLRDGRPEVRAAAQALQQSASAAIAELRGDAGQTGTQSAAELAEHMRAKGQSVYNAGKYLGNKAEAGFKAGWGFPKLLYSVGPNKPPKAPAGKKAGGGPASGLTWVGEQGPELVSLPSGSFVHNARNSERMAGGGNVIHVNFNSIVAPTPQQVRPLVKELTLEMRRQHVL